MKKPTNLKKYIFGKKLVDTNANVVNIKNEIIFNLPAIAQVLDGFNFAIIQDQPIATNEGLFDIYVNNEVLIENAEVLNFALMYYSLAFVSFLPSNNNKDPYHPTPRPLSGSDEIRIRFHDSYWTNVSAGLKPPTIYIHLHYQPK